MNILVTAPFSERYRKILADKAAALGCSISFGCDIPLLSQADIVIGDIPPDRIDLCGRLRWLQLTSSGADKYTYGALPKNILLTNAAGAFGEGMSEYIAGTLLAAFRGLFSYRENQKRRIWEDNHRERLIYGSRILILGCGDIGRKTAVRLKAFGAHIVGIRRSACPADGFDEVYDTSALDRELPLADIVIGCLPRTPLTDRLLDRRRIGLIKDGAFFVNVGRGTLTDTEALIGALSGGKLSGAVLDVFETEPLPTDSPLWSMENVLITPHISGPGFGHSPHTEEAIALICTQNLERYTSGLPLINIVC